jgi:cytochrome c oxidase subunit II
LSTRGRLATLLAAGVLLAACNDGAPSTIDPRGPAAASIAWLWWVLLGLGLAVFALTVGFLLVAALRRPPERGPRFLAGPTQGFVLFWGVAMPAVVLLFLAGLNVVIGERTYAPPSEPELTVDVIGHKFWWEIHYPDHGVITANELYLPAGEPVRLRLAAADVIHAFWVPQLHGKMDMVPGETNEFWIEADEPGEYRGICAEYCGLQHANMHFLAVALTADEFDDWLAARAAPPAPDDPETAAGVEVFVAANCIACHAVAGLREPTDVGPDLTDFASRRSLAAGIRPNTRAELADWILDPHAVKPGVHMPPTELDEADLEALLDFLATLDPETSP